MRSTITDQQDRLKELFDLIKENPDLPIVPMVDEEIVADDCCSRWMGSWGSAQIEKIYVGGEQVYFYEPDDWGEVEKVINDMATTGEDFDFENMTDEAALAAYEAAPWIKAIVVDIDLPELP